MVVPNGGTQIKPQKKLYELISAKKKGIPATMLRHNKHQVYFYMLLLVNNGIRTWEERLCYIYRIMFLRTSYWMIEIISNWGQALDAL